MKEQFWWRTVLSFRTKAQSFFWKVLYHSHGLMSVSKYWPAIVFKAIVTSNTSWWRGKYKFCQLNVQQLHFHWGISTVWVSGSCLVALITAGTFFNRFKWNLRVLEPLHAYKSTCMYSVQCHILDFRLKIGFWIPTGFWLNIIWLFCPSHPRMTHLNYTWTYVNRFSSN